MPTKEDIDDVLQRIAIAALAYHPDIPTTHPPEYQLADDVIWCLQPLTGLPI